MVKERDSILEIGSSGSECRDDPRSKRAKNLLRSLNTTLSFEGSDEGECSSNSIRNSVKTSDGEYDIESLIKDKFEGQKGEHMPFIEKTQTKEKHRPRISKASKPPRPSKPPSLDTADLWLVREISGLLMEKRARFERLRALKKMRAARSSSPSLPYSSLFAMAITVLFFIIIIFQGFGSGKSSTLSVHESPEPSAATSSGLVNSKPPNIVEQTFGSDPRTVVKHLAQHTSLLRPGKSL